MRSPVFFLVGAVIAATLIGGGVFAWASQGSDPQARTPEEVTLGESPSDRAAETPDANVVVPPPPVTEAPSVVPCVDDDDDDDDDSDDEPDDDDDRDGLDDDGDDDDD
ncbi:hypothetical protein [Nocardiopsis sp. CNT312]|uniref:hypothetical protein n=1 Tax=Nocardiopsis sp. CNT312 TaxID=1137268 RepID=UPI0018CBF7EE|nr:hypothetical protein [Nocardiopsis sp. CNT312]